MTENYIPDEPIIPMLERAAAFAREHNFARGWYEPYEKAKAEIKRLTDILTRNGFDAKTGKPPLGNWPPNFILKEEMEKLKIENSKLEYLKMEYAQTIETLRLQRNDLEKRLVEMKERAK